ncbi:class I SAM-dependent methyltransferase [uncultured Cohaesibacter sp.]|uniref:class I SAM-dependent methyltransferase n=1 Tax=uncultured Cohaesibacter sp. TaxID=1002546 RepID=UPI00292F718F|nr:class I SAM-dependent methyltransferase [uncultured Cohaesibacter sp.]
MPTAKEFWETEADKYVARPIANMPAYEMTMERTRAYLKPDDKVLEMGCGSGNTAMLLSRHVSHIWANDLCSRFIEIGSSKAREKNITNIDFIEGDIMAPELDNHAPYDCLLAFNLIHLFKDIPGAIERMHALIKPGGIFISKTGCLSGMRGLLRIPIAIMQVFGKAPHVSFVSASKLEAIMRTQGFEILESRTFPKAGGSQFIIARKL